jgi:hypothetical protein
LGVPPHFHVLQLVLACNDDASTAPVIAELGTHWRPDDIMNSARRFVYNVKGNEHAITDYVDRFTIDVHPSKLGDAKTAVQEKLNDLVSKWVDHRYVNR